MPSCQSPPTETRGRSDQQRHRQRHQPTRPDKPTMVVLTLEKGRGETDSANGDKQRRQQPARKAHTGLLNPALGLPDDPASPEHGITDDQADAGEQAETAEPVPP